MERGDDVPTEMNPEENRGIGQNKTEGVGIEPTADGLTAGPRF